MSSSAEIQQRVLAAFQIESREQLEVIRALVAAWPAPSAAMVEEAFRMAHSMKGGARVCDLTEVEGQAHQLESLLAAMVKAQVAPSEEVRGQIERIANAVEDLMAAPETETGPAEGSPVTPESSRMEKLAPLPPAPAQDTVRIDASHLESFIRSSNQLMTESVRQEQVERDIGVLSREIEQLRRLVESGRGIEVDLKVTLADLGRHLHRIRLQQQQCSRAVRVLGEQMETDVRRAGMVPISSIFEGFPKMIRDIAARENKLVHFVMTGTELKADRAVLQLLKDPVMHALRNAVAHGLELPGHRIASGKPETGELRLEMEISGNQLRVSIIDDGKGVDLDRVRAKAVQAGLVAADHAAELSPEALVDLLFHTGFSTASSITRVAGRGVGLSVVKERVTQLQGNVRLVRSRAVGTSLELEVPLAIAAHRLLLVKAGHQTFALPLRVIRSLQRTADIRLVEGKSMVMCDGVLLPLATLSLAAGLPPVLVRDQEGRIAIALLKGERPIALHVEDFIRETNALIKPLPLPASHSPHFSGGVLLEDGTIALVLNTESLQQRFQGQAFREERQAAPAPPPRRTVLVVDDSFTARTLQKSILEAAGYTVKVAVDGRSALALLRAEVVSLVVSDIQMPHLDGFGLLHAMKLDPALAKLPVILVTSLAAAEDQERGLALGADAYMVKQRFDHQELLDAVRQLI